MCDLESPNIIFGKHLTLREIELHFCYKSPNESYFYSDLLPDIDINALALGLIKKDIVLYNWHKARDPDLEHDLPLIITEDSILLQRIVKLEMRIISEDKIDEERILKYKNKGYTFIT